MVELRLGQSSYLIRVPDTSVQSISVSNQKNPEEYNNAIELRELTRDGLNASDAGTFTAE